MRASSKRLKIVKANSKRISPDEFVDRIKRALEQATYAWRDIALAFSEAADQYGTNSVEFRTILATTGYNQSAASKFIAIARSDRLKKYERQLSQVGTWTVLYSIASLSDERFAKLNSMLALDKAKKPVVVTSRIVAAVCEKPVDEVLAFLRVASEISNLACAEKGGFFSAKGERGSILAYGCLDAKLKYAVNISDLKKLLSIVDLMNDPQAKFEDGFVSICDHSRPGTTAIYKYVQQPGHTALGSLSAIDASFRVLSNIELPADAFEISRNAAIGLSGSAKKLGQARERYGWCLTGNDSRLYVDVLLDNDPQSHNVRVDLGECESSFKATLFGDSLRLPVDDYSVRILGRRIDPINSNGSTRIAALRFASKTRPYAFFVATNSESWWVADKSDSQTCSSRSQSKSAQRTISKAA